jgi:hypothetical protein
VPRDRPAFRVEPDGEGAAVELEIPMRRLPENDKKAFEKTF